MLHAEPQSCVLSLWQIEGNQTFPAHIKWKIEPKN